jgi:hypothetical protein
VWCLAAFFCCSPGLPCQQQSIICGPASQANVLQGLSEPACDGRAHHNPAMQWSRSCHRASSTTRLAPNNNSPNLPGAPGAC